MIGRADIEGSKSYVAMNAWQPQASYPCGNFSDTSSFRSETRAMAKGSIGRAFAVRIRTENQNQASFYPFAPHEISVLIELPFGHPRYPLTDVPPQPNSPPENVFALGPARGGPAKRAEDGSPTPRRPRDDGCFQNLRRRTPPFDGIRAHPLHKRISESTSRVVVFQGRR
jgi:hypothetical protein